MFELHYTCMQHRLIFYICCHSQDADLLPKDDVTVRMVRIAPDSSGRELTSNLYHSLGNISASKRVEFSERSSLKHRAIPAKSSRFGEEDTMRGDTFEVQLPVDKTEKQHTSSTKAQSFYSLQKPADQSISQSAGGLVKRALRSEQHLEGQVKSMATEIPLENPLLSSLSRFELPRGVSEPTLTSSSEIFHSCSGDEGVEPFPALSSSIAPSELAMPYSSEWKLSSLASPLTLATEISRGGGGSGLDHTLSTAKVHSCELITSCLTL